MSLLIVFVLVLILTFLVYVGYVIHKKALNPREIRVYSIGDAKKLLTLPATTGPQRYLAKMA